MQAFPVKYSSIELQLLFLLLYIHLVISACTREMEEDKTCGACPQTVYEYIPPSAKFIRVENSKGVQHKPYLRGLHLTLFWFLLIYSGVS